MSQETNTQNNQDRDAEMESLFFNVMPKAKGRSPLVSDSSPPTATPPPQPPPPPQIQTSPTVQSAASPYTSSKKKSVNKIALIILLVLLLGVGGYFGYTKFGKSLTDTIKNKFGKTTTTTTKTDTEAGPPPSGNETAPVVVTTDKEWQVKYFGAETCITELTCGDVGDPDHDGLSNVEEFQSKTDPNNPDSDTDGLADGDEKHIFAGDPLNVHTAGSIDYTDADDIRGGYDTSNKGVKMNPERIAALSQSIKQFGLHEPTITTLGKALEQYGVVSGAPGDGPTPAAPSPEGSPESMLDRDTQRLATIKKIGVALYKYFKDTSFYPATNDFGEMLNKIKPYNTVATNPTDPVNHPPFVYTYASSGDAKDFTITYYSETQNQLIKYSATNAAKDSTQEVGAVNDDQRMRDLESIRQALLIYSAANAAGSQAFVFPTEEKYKSELVPKYLQSIPKDPKNSQEYEYKVSKTFDSFTLKALFENPPGGVTGFLCNQEECQNY